MNALDIGDIGSIKKLSGEIHRISIDTGKFTLIVKNNTAFWTSSNLIDCNDELEMNLFTGLDCITQAVDHYIKVIGEDNGKA